MSPTLVGSRCIQPSVTLCAECEQKNPIEKPFKFCIHRSVTLCAECERYTRYSMNKESIHSSAHITRGSIMVSDVRRKANAEDRLKRRREHDRNQGHRESLRNPGQNICSDCFNRVLDCSIRVYRSFGAISKVGPRAKCPSFPPLGGPDRNRRVQPVYIALIKTNYGYIAISGVDKKVHVVCH